MGQSSTPIVGQIWTPVYTAVIGDIAGSRFEGRARPKDFELFHQLCTYTDDTVCTAAIAYIIINDRKPDRGYGGAFRRG